MSMCIYTYISICLLVYELEFIYLSVCLNIYSYITLSTGQDDHKIKVLDENS
jgi:hypothetical protein